MRHYTTKPGLRRRVRDVFAASPGYAFAGFVHLLALVLLSFWTVSVALDERSREPVQVRLTAASETVLAAPEVSAKSLDALAPPDLEQVLHDSRSETSSDDPFQEALGASAGHLAESARVFGVGASGGAGRGGGRPDRGGPSTASEGALRSGLEWLARHRAASGAWDEPSGCGGQDRACLLPKEGQVAHTALALLCFLCADHGPEKEGPYQQLVQRAITWLVERVDRDGVFDSDFQGYHQGIGTLALAEALARRRTPELERAVKRAVKCLENAQHQAGGWRYRPREAADTSVTSWVALGLKSAEHAGVSVHASTWRSLQGYLDAVSYADGTTGYMRNGRGSVAMGASGFFLRLMLGEAPATGRNRAAAGLLSRHGEALEARGSWDLYAVYYTALAMYQVGGARWRELNPRVRDGLVGQQRTQGCERGAWRWNGHLLGTTFALLTLETYYRYLPVHGGVDEDPEELDERSPGVRLLQEATLSLERALEHGDNGLVLAAEAAFETALEALTAEPGEWARPLEAEVRARLVQCVALQGDPERALARADEYLARLPAGLKPQVLVLRVRRAELVRRAIEASSVAAAPGAPDSALELADAALKAARAALERERDALAAAEPAQAREAAEAARALETAQLHLGFALAPERQLDEVRAALTAPADGRAGPAGPAELLALEGVLQRALRTLTLVAREELPAARIAGAEDDLAWLEARRALERTPADVTRRLRAGLERAALVRVMALLAVRRDAAAAQAARAFRAAHPQSGSLAEAEALERAALSRRAEAGAATADEQERLVQLLVAWSKAAPPDEVATPWLAVGELLLARGAVDDADRCFARALADPALPPEAAHQARLARARLARARGALDEARALLDDLERERADVRLEGCALLRARGRPGEALAGYQALLRGLEAERPPAWWDAVEGVAGCYVELGELGAARRFLDELRRTDPTFGGDDARRRRIVDLMVRLDAAR